MIQVTLLGVSSLVPLPDRAETAAQLVCGGHSILFDCGEGTQTAARKAGVSLMKTDVIALTHYHGDHIFGIPGLLQTMSVMGRTDPLTIVGPGDITSELSHILALAGNLPYPVRLRTIPQEGVLLETLSPGWPSGARLIPVPTFHRGPSQGYQFLLPRAGKFLPEKARAQGIPVSCWSRLQRGETVAQENHVYTPDMVLGESRKGLKVVYSGDSAFCQTLIEGSQGADLLLCESTYGENDQEQLAHSRGHMTFAQAGKIAREAGVSRLWLMHYSQMIEDPEIYLENAKLFFDAAECGKDGKAITLLFDTEERSHANEE